MMFSALERKTLWAAIEDYAGLWELVWELATSCPEIPEVERLPVAQRVVRNLLEHGCIELFERSQVGGIELRIPVARWIEVLSDQANWYEPSRESIEVLIGVTPAGEALYSANE